MHTQYLTHNNTANFLYTLYVIKEMKDVLFDYILIIFRIAWNYNNNNALNTLVTATVFLIVIMIAY
jgi:hypothetical protein